MWTSAEHVNESFPSLFVEWETLGGLKEEPQHLAAVAMLTEMAAKMCFHGTCPLVRLLPYFFSGSCLAGRFGVLSLSFRGRSVRVLFSVMVRCILLPDDRHVPMAQAVQYEIRHA